MSSFFTSHHMPCPDCGASVPEPEREEHSCDPMRQLEFRVLQLREEVAGFDASLNEYLDSAQGRFAQWLAERERKKRRRRR